MTIIDEYLEYQNNTEKKYGKKSIVIMEVGHFFEFYGLEPEENSIGILHEIADILNIQVTRKNKSVLEVSRGNPYMAGFPSLALKKHLIQLLHHGYTVVVIEQVTPPPNPKREITKILSPGTYIEDTNNFDYNNILSIHIQREVCFRTNKTLNIIGLSVIDLTTGNGTTYEVYSNPKDKDFSIEETVRFIQTYNPREILVTTQNLDKEGDLEEIFMLMEIGNRVVHVRNDLIEKTYLKKTYQNKFLKEIFGDTGVLSPIEYLDLENKPAALVSFMSLLQFCYEHNENIVQKIRKPEFWESQKYLILENNAIQQLNLVPCGDGNIVNNSRYNSLFSIICNTSTAIGKRFLRDRLLMPILDVNELRTRYDLIELFLEKEEELDIYKYSLVEKMLIGINDIERLHRKMNLCMLHPSEFFNLHMSYEKICNLVKYIQNSFKDNKVMSVLPNGDSLESFYDFRNEYFNNFEIEELQKYHLNEISGSFFKEGIFKEVDDLVLEIKDGRRYLDSLAWRIHELIDKYCGGGSGGHDMAKVDSNDRDGYYINVTKRRYDSLKKALDKNGIKEIKFEDWKVKIEDLKLVANSSNYRIGSNGIKDASRLIVEKTEKMKVVCKECYLECLRRYNRKYQSKLYDLVKFIANIDVIKSGAKTAKLNNYVKPIINVEMPESFIRAEEVRHPIIEKIIKHEYIPNWVRLGCNLEEDKIDKTDRFDSNNKNGKLKEEQFMNGMLLFSCNSLGKSCYMKSVGLSVILAQMGMYVPASSFEYKPFKTLLTRIVGNDNLFKGLSSFAVEMGELRGILNRADENSLVLGDEICHGTEQVSGISLVASSLSWLDKRRTKFVFATHLHNLSSMTEVKELKGVKNYHLEVVYDENNDRLVYKRNLIPGSGNSVYGIEVARAMGLDKEFIEYANKIRKRYSKNSEKILGSKSSRYNSEVYVKNCEVCGELGVDTHHIKFQSNADADGFVDHRHKNHYSNLVILCKECHNKVHHGGLEIRGYIETSEGVKLDWE